ncbi:MAG: HEAT repeat domain-containing protein [Urechidicola sp.]|nr:HEAT repeat domain-containing protein [Urechidicola sp.]
MGFYDLSKEERKQLVADINTKIEKGLLYKNSENLIDFFSDEDTYIRKAGYLAVGKIYIKKNELQKIVISYLKTLFLSDSEKIRQTVINAAGEIGKTDFKIVQPFFDKGFLDQHHSVRNAVIGSLKKMSEKNPKPVLLWAKTYLKHEDKEIRREVCHGIELRGRTHPQDILPLLKVLEFDKTKRVSNTLIHVLGQIAYKKGCLQTVVKELNNWENNDLVQSALDEIVDVHRRYKDFAILTQQEVIDYIDKNYRPTNGTA